MGMYIEELARLRRLGEISTSENYRYVERMAEFERMEQYSEENPGTVAACCGTVCMGRIVDCPHRPKGNGPIYIR